MNSLRGGTQAALVVGHEKNFRLSRYFPWDFFDYLINAASLWTKSVLVLNPFFSLNCQQQITPTCLATIFYFTKLCMGRPTTRVDKNPAFRHVRGLMLDQSLLNKAHWVLPISHRSPSYIFPPSFPSQLLTYTPLFLPAPLFRTVAGSGTYPKKIVLLGLKPLLSFSTNVPHYVGT